MMPNGGELVESLANCHPIENPQSKIGNG